MDLRYTPAQQAFRAEVRDWLRANVPQEPFASYDTREGFEQHRQWEAKLFDSRLSMVMWPTELGGRGCDLIEWLIFEEEYYGAGAPMRVNQNGQLLLGPTLMEFGTEAQKKRQDGRRPAYQHFRQDKHSRNGMLTIHRLCVFPDQQRTGCE